MKNDNIQQALGIFLDTMRPFVRNLIEKNYPGKAWEGEFFRMLTPEKQNLWNAAQRQGVEPIVCIDFHNLSFVATKFRDELAAEIGGKSETFTFDNCLRELQKVRNKCQHFTPIDEDERDRAFSNLITIAKLIGDEELRAEMVRLKNHVAADTPQPVIAPAQADQTPSFVPISTADESTVPTPWFNNCLPHYDIRSGNLDESVFAANLSEVALGTGPAVYTDPMTFFSKTYLTAGLRDLAKRVVLALNGEESENRIISLQTGFGGGKTHSLISVYHIAKGGAPLLNSGVCQGLLPGEVEANFSDAKVAVFTNNTCDVAQGREVEEGFTIHTIWGEIAYQLGGKEAYDTIRQNDVERIAPTSSLIQPILEKAGISLILIDELAAYCVNASAKRVGGGTLYEQTLTFVQNLTEAVSHVRKCVLIATLPASKSEVANSQKGAEILDSLNERLVRLSAHVKPVDEQKEVFEVVRRRLFEQIKDTDVINNVAERYKRMYHNRRSDLPESSDGVEYANQIRSAYPFHPELIRMFRDRWGSDSKFQRTRGVLRLLASIVQDLWKRRDNITGSQALIHTSDVKLGNLPTLTGTITNLMGSQWDTVMSADVYGESSNARRIDEQDPASTASQYGLTQGIASTILMSSIGAKLNKGLDIKEIKRCVLRPNAFNHNDVDAMLGKLEQIAHYLHTSKVGISNYWFESKANVNIMLAQAQSDVKQEEINKAIIDRLKQSVSFVSNIHALVSPSGDIPEQKTLTLVILSPEYAIPVGEMTSSLKRVVTNIALKKGNTDRIYRNTILYLVTSEAGRATLNDKLRGYIACEKIIKEKGSSLDTDQRKDIADRKSEYEKQAKDALIRAYNTVLRYSAKEGIERYEMKNYASDFSTQISTYLINELKEEEWLISAIGRGLLDRINMLPTVEHPVKVKELYETFLRFDDKPKITGPDAVIETVNKYCNNGGWNVGFGTEDNYTKIHHESTVPFLDVSSEDFWLLDPSVMPTKPNTGSGTGTETTETGNGDGTGSGSGSGEGAGAGSGTSGSSGSTTTYKKVTISGEVPLENYAQLFSSFINTLKNNNLHIEIKFTAKSTPTNPLTDASATFKSIKESASQLGLDLTTEE